MVYLAEIRVVGLYIYSQQHSWNPILMSWSFIRDDMTEPWMLCWTTRFTAQGHRCPRLEQNTSILSQFSWKVSDFHLVTAFQHIMMSLKGTNSHLHKSLGATSPQNLLTPAFHNKGNDSDSRQKHGKREQKRRTEHSVWDLLLTLEAEKKEFVLLHADLSATFLNTTAPGPLPVSSTAQSHIPNQTFTHPRWRLSVTRSSREAERSFCSQVCHSCLASWRLVGFGWVNLWPRRGQGRRWQQGVVSAVRSMNALCTKLPTARKKISVSQCLYYIYLSN